VYVAYHVGSAREDARPLGIGTPVRAPDVRGSAERPDGEHFRLIQSAGGSLNGTTSFDRTWYYEVLPAQHLELALWLEADRMGDSSRR
jgi:predicted Zn-dependent peptidase